jgi:aspartyl-tRNA(Asn)/glutamyl-tRNA(Gln) amidotransferase subunit C
VEDFNLEVLMVDINEKTIKKIAQLSRININEQEVSAIAKKLGHIIGWVEQLDAVNVTNVEPMTSVISIPLKMRQDIVTDGGYPDIIVKNAPIKDGHFFCVPKVVE